MCAIIHHSSYFNYYFILEKVEGQNMSDKYRKRRRQEKGGKGEKIQEIRSKQIFLTMFLFSYLRTLSEDHVARLLVTHSLNLPILVQAGNTILPECVQAR